MQTVLTIIGIILGIVLFFVFYGVVIYNKLISLKNRYVNGFAQIDVQLQRRYDLIPNLVETAKEYMEYEKSTLTKVVEARNLAKEAEQYAASNPSSQEYMDRLTSAESALGGAMGRFFALMEDYPDLKANTTMRQLMEELTSTENKVSFARQAYNDAVMYFNTYRSQFPSNIVAGLFDFTPAPPFEIKEEKAREAVKVSFR